MKTVRLQGISLKGKNRIREHGEIWDIIQQDKDCLLIQSQINYNYVRWIKEKNDPHFVIIAL